MSRILLFQCKECVVKMLKSETTLFACGKQLGFYRTKKKTTTDKFKEFEMDVVPINHYVG